MPSRFTPAARRSHNPTPPQSQRLSALEGFKRGKYQVLVATDIAARGLNVEGISHVINYDVPAFAEDYIHRIGRTGRASATGDAVTFVSTDEMQHLRKIEKFINRKFEMEACQGFNYSKSLALRKPAKTAEQAAKPGVKPAYKPAAKEERGRRKSSGYGRQAQKSDKFGPGKKRKKAARRFER
jgi:ATP-dependent RNA helicase RhlE